MPAFCDVALPVPLDRVFTYAAGVELHVGGAGTPVVGGRVLVPFRTEKMAGIVTRLHDEPPPVEAKAILLAIDAEPILSAELMALGEWIAAYYIAPLGEVLRTMLPLMAEVKRDVLYRITQTGVQILYEGAQRGSSRRSRLTAEQQDREYAVLNYLVNGEPAKETTLRGATKANPRLLAGMVAKEWLARESAIAQRDARRLVRYAVLVEDARLPKLNENQQLILAELAATGNAMPVAELKRLAVPESTLGTLVKRGLVRIEERAAEFVMGGGTLHAGREAHLEALNEAQTAALAEVVVALKAGTQQAGTGGAFKPILLHGVTGSGKTAVYLAAMQRSLAAGRSALLLVPEIGLTPAMAGQLHTAFGPEVALLHSALTADERAEQWYRIHRGDARIVVGTRSAVFAPVRNLGLVIVDEEHDSSYKQEEMPRYHARDVAVMRAKLAGAVIVLGSATPSLESWANTVKGKYALIEMRARVMDRPLPVVELLDMKKEFQETGHEHLFSRALIEQTQAAIDRNEQVIILLNRRGYSHVVLCRACGMKLQCENCAIALTYHKPVLGADVHAQAGERLECHYCGFRRTIPKRCPDCDSEYLYFFGAGSQQGEERLQELFPTARIGRMDRDTVRGRHNMERLLARLHSGEINLLVGTQMIAKGHDIHGVTLVGVVGADHALSMPDFRAAERVFQLLTQVSGRAGRGELPGRVLVQTYHTDHYAIQAAAKHDFAGFVERELKFRKWMHYPPNAALANVLLEGPSLEQVAAWAGTLGRWFRESNVTGVRVLGPAAAPIARIRRIYRFHILLKAEKRSALGAALKAMLARAAEMEIPRRNLVVDVDPVNLM